VTKKELLDRMLKIKQDLNVLTSDIEEIVDDLESVATGGDTYSNLVAAMDCVSDAVSGLGDFADATGMS
jgi:hypothetical protein